MISDDYERPTSGSKGERIIISCEVQIKREPRHEKKNNKMSVRPAKTQIRLGIRPV